jgi:hypothetical protein
MRKVNALLLFCILGMAARAQQNNFWKPVSEATLGKILFEGKQKPREYRLFQLDETSLQSITSLVPSESTLRGAPSTFELTVPDADGNLRRFRIQHAPVMDAALAARHRGIYSFLGHSAGNDGAVIRFAFSPLGFSGTIFSPGKPTHYIEKVDKASRTYAAVARTTVQQLPFECSTQPGTRNRAGRLNATGPQWKNADDGKLRTFRLAMACTGEYAQAWLDGTEANDAARRTKVLAAMNNHMTRVNGIMERDFGIRMTLIANNDLLIYLNGASDPWTSEFNTATQNTIDGVIGNDNYDIGHLLKTGGDNGNAGSVGNVCVAGAKGRAFTSRSNWASGIFFEEYILTHEMGHQYDANHTFSHASEGTIAQVEPGSGNSIMSYAGITGAATDIQSLMDDYFHAVSIQQATDWIKSHSCHATPISGLNVPTASAGADYTVPKSTPFRLTGTGSDADGEDVLTYTWEQMNVAPSFPWIPSASATSGPAFKSFGPSASSSRTFPALASILDGTNGNKWEVLPSAGRSLDFRFTVRDNHTGSGSNKSDDMVVTIDGTTGPFSVTAPNTSLTWCPGAHTVTWSVNGSNALAANVNILLSYDGGNTFPLTLAANTPNDGSQSVTIPCAYSATARIKVEAVGNIFFDISNANFTVGDNTKPTFTVPANITIYKDASCNYNASIAITGDVTDEADNCDNTLNATHADLTAAGTCVGETVITRTWTLMDDCGNSTVKVQTITVRDLLPPTFTVPANTTIYKDAACKHDASPSITGDVTDEADNCDNTLNATYADVTVPGSCIGEEIITRTWTLTDDCSNTTSKIQTITVRDVTPPVISAQAANQATLWPPDHRMVLVTVSYNLTDNCSPAAAITSSLSVTSNEPVNGLGDGDTGPDWIIINKNQVWLRAERAGPRNARVYTITINATDDCGNAATPKTVTVRVEHDQRNVRTINPGNGDLLGLTALPNPTHSSFVVAVNSKSNEQINLRVVDLLGRVVENRTIMNPQAVLKIGEGYSPGIYIIRATQGSLIKEVKLIKLKD